MRTLRLSVLLLIVTLPIAACSSCKKPATAEPEPAPTAAVPAPAASAAPEPTTSASAPPPIAAPASIAAGAKPVAGGGPFTGTYKCLGHLTLSQNGSSVFGRSAKFGDDEDTFACTVSGDICTGTETRTRAPKGKPSKVVKTRRVTFKRDPSGTLHYSADGNAPQNCFK